MNPFYFGMNADKSSERKMEAVHPPVRLKNVSEILFQNVLRDSGAQVLHAGA